MDAYNELLNATIAHLEGLKGRGVRFVPLDPAGLRALSPSAAAQATAGPARPATPARARAAAAAPRIAVPESAPDQKTLPSVPPPRAPAAPVTLSNNHDKAAGIQELRERALVCQKCANLASSRKNVVFGIGSIDAELMFVGEAPGAEEDVEGEPFVGRAGQLLTKIILTMGLSRETVYIANILKCRPDTPNQSFGNRPPTPEEMDRCLPYLHAQIDLIKPKAIVALGGTAVDGLFGKVPGVGITKQRGRWREYRGIPVMPTYHPSYLLRPNPNNIKRECWEDMMAVMERLGMPISEKQRGYFLKG